MRRVPLLIAVLALVAPLLGASPSFAEDLLWIGSPAAEARTQTLLKALRAAGDHGLDPAWYGVEEIEQALKSNADSNRTEQRIGEAFAAYASDVSTGRVNANSVDPDITIEQRKIGRADLLKAAADSPDFAAWLANLAPKGDYPALQKALAAWRQKRSSASYTPVPDGDALKPGMTDARVPVLRKRLGELDMTVPAATGAPEFSDDALAAVVKSYQATKGLTVDGVIGSGTTALAQHFASDDRIEQIVANLERRRWLPEDLGRRYVFVNTGDYSMVFDDDGKPVFQSLVIVGTPKHPTPEIQSVMYGFQTNPYWTVPQSISGDEYLPLLRRDPNALAAQGFKIFSSWSDNDSEIDPSTVDWNSINPKAFPYRVRQEPGATNALGYIFFPFANSYGIYMHDTATRWLFTEGSRNFSHGCIRLLNPLDFVEKVFNGRGSFDKKRVQAVIDSGEQAHYTFPECS